MSTEPGLLHTATALNDALAAIPGSAVIIGVGKCVKYVLSFYSQLNGHLKGIPREKFMEACRQLVTSILLWNTSILPKAPAVEAEVVCIKLRLCKLEDPEVGPN